MLARKIIAVVLVCLYATALSGCVTKVEKKDEITMWLVGSEAQARTIVDLSREFTSQTGIKVVCEAISWWGAHSKYLTSIAGGVTPDIGTMGLTWGMEFGELGAMVDLNAVFPDDVAVLGSNIFAGIIESTKLGDKVFGVPLDLSEQIIYYRTDIIPEPPETWKEFLDLVKKMRSENRGVIFDWGSMEWIGFAPFLWQAGGDFFNSDYTDVTLDTPEAIAALEYFAGLYAAGIPKTQIPIEQGMRTGDYPMAISGSWKIISLQLGAPEIREKWSIATLPKGPSGKHTAFVGGRIMGIFSSSKMKNEAWNFIKFLSDKDTQHKLYQASLKTEDAYLPPNIATWDVLKMESNFKNILIAQAKDTKGPPPVLGWDSVTRFVNHAIQMVVLKGADPTAQLKEAAENMRKELHIKK